MPVVAILAPKVEGTEGEICILSGITELPEAILAYIQGRVPTFQLKFSKTTGRFSPTCVSRRNGRRADRTKAAEEAASAHAVRAAIRGPMATRARAATKVIKEIRVLLVQLVLSAHRDPLDFKVHKVLQDRLDRLAPTEPQVRLVPPVFRERLGRSVHRALKVPPVPTADWGLMAHRVRKDPLVPRAPLDQSDRQGLQGRLDHKDLPDQPAQLDRSVQLGLRELLEHKDLADRKDLLELLDPMDLQDPPAHRDPQVCKGRRESRARQAHPVHRAPTVHRVLPDLQVQPDLRDL